MGRGTINSRNARTWQSQCQRASTEEWPPGAEDGRPERINIMTTYEKITKICEHKEASEMATKMLQNAIERGQRNCYNEIAEAVYSIYFEK